MNGVNLYDEKFSNSYFSHALILNAIYLYTNIQIYYIGDNFMITTIRIDKDLQQQLKMKSAETGKSQLDLANQYILDGLKNDKTPAKPAMSLDEIEKLLKHDLPEGDDVSEKLTGLANSPVRTNAVELKKASYKRG